MLNQWAIKNAYSCITLNGLDISSGIRLYRIQLKSFYSYLTVDINDFCTVITLSTFSI